LHYFVESLALRYFEKLNRLSIYRHLLPQNEDTNYLETLYYVVQITTTVGFGAPTPISIGGRALTIVFAPLAILSFAVFVAFTSTTAIEIMQEKYRRSEERIFGSNGNARKGRSQHASTDSTSDPTLAQMIVQLERENRARARAQVSSYFASLPHVGVYSD